MKLYAALGIEAGDIVAFAGAGGKSGAILAIADELREDGITVLVAPTTKMSLSEAEMAGPLVTSEDIAVLTEKAGEAISSSRTAVTGSGLISRKRVGGVDPEQVGSLAKLAGVTLVEADGSRRRPLKGTADHEPVLPVSSTLVVAVGNVSALGMPVDEEYVHRPDVFSELTGVGAGQTITARAFARALAQGSLGHIPSGARAAALITGVEPGRSMADAAGITRELWRLGVKKVVLSSLPGKAPALTWLP